MGDCNCGKNARPTGFGTNLNAEQRAQVEEVARQGLAPSNGAQQQAVAAGGVQGFNLRTSDGRVQSFGSALERNAHKVRHGGTIIS